MLIWSCEPLCKRWVRAVPKQGRTSVPEIQGLDFYLVYSPGSLLQLASNKTSTCVRTGLLGHPVKVGQLVGLSAGWYCKAGLKAVVAGSEVR